MAKAEWRDRFIEVVVKGIRKVHHDYLIWSYGRPGILHPRSFRNYNVGPGFELAGELTVCASITQEALNSSLMMDNEKYYTIDREVQYPADPSLHADIVVQRCEIVNKKVDSRLPPVYIEAKRARNYIPNLSSGRIEKKSPNYNDVVEDIFKLNKVPKGSLRYLLIWGEYLLSDKAPLSPIVFLSEVDKRLKKDSRYTNENLDLTTSRIFPVSWEGDDAIKFQIVKAGWAMLVEIL